MCYTIIKGKSVWLTGAAREQIGINLIVRGTFHPQNVPAERFLRQLFHGSHGDSSSWAWSSRSPGSRRSSATCAGVVEASDGDPPGPGPFDLGYRDRAGRWHRDMGILWFRKDVIAQTPERV